MGQTRPLSARLGLHFAACAAVTAAAAQHAHAEVIRWDCNLVIPANFNGLYINIATRATGSTGSGTPGWDINPYGSTTLNFFASATAPNPTTTYVRTQATGGPSRLQETAVIGPASTFANSTTAVISATGVGSNGWTINSVNYFGFRFHNNVTNAINYGYGAMQVGATAAQRTLLFVSYESDGSSIAIPPSGPYDPCATSNPIAASGPNSLPYRDDGTVASVNVCGTTIPAANYYKFTAGDAGNYTFETCPTAGSATIALLTACDTSASVLGCGGSACGGNGSALSANLAAGQAVYVVIGGTQLGSTVPVTVTAPPIEACTAAPVATYGANAISSTVNPGLSQSVRNNPGQTASSTIVNRQWFRFTPTASGLFSLKTCGSTGDTLLAIGTTCPAAGSIFGTIGYNDDSCGLLSWLGEGSTSTAGFPLTQPLEAGTTYYVCVGGFSSAAFSGELIIEGPDGSPYDPCSPANPTLAAGANSKAYRTDTVADLSACGGTVPAANYYRFTPVVDGSHTIRVCPSAGSASLAVLGACTPGAPVLACGTGTTDCGSGASATVALSAGSDVFVVVGGSGLPPILDISVQGPPNPACINGVVATYGDNLIDAQPNTAPNQLVFSDAGQTTSATIFNAQWLKFTPTATGQFTFKICEAGDTRLAIATSCVSVDSRLGTIAYNDDASPAVCPATPGGTLNYGSWIDATNGGATGTFAGFPLTQDLVAGQTYYICVGGFGSTTSVFGNLNISGPEGPACPADLNNNGIVNGDDLGILLTAWGACPAEGSCPADLNNSGIVNGDDLGILLTAWGACPN